MAISRLIDLLQVPRRYMLFDEAIGGGTVHHAPEEKGRQK